MAACTQSKILFPPLSSTSPTSALLKIWTINSRFLSSLLTYSFLITTIISVTRSGHTTTPESDIMGQTGDDNPTKMDITYSARTYNGISSTDHDANSFLDGRSKSDLTNNFIRDNNYPVMSRSRVGPNVKTRSGKGFQKSRHSSTFGSVFTMQVIPRISHMSTQSRSLIDTHFQHVSSNVEDISHIFNIVDGTSSHTSSNVDGTSHTSNNGDGKSHTSSNVDGTSNTSNNVDGTSRTSSNVDGTSHTSNNVDGTSHTSSNVDGTSHTSNNVEGTSHTSNNVDGTSHISNNVDGTSHTSNNVDGASHMSNNVEGTSHTSNNVDGTSHTSNNVDGTSHTSNNVDGTSHTSNNVDGTSHTSNNVDGTSHTSNNGDDIPYSSNTVDVTSHISNSMDISHTSNVVNSVSHTYVNGISHTSVNGLPHTAVTVGDISHNLNNMSDTLHHHTANNFVNFESYLQKAESSTNAVGNFRVYYPKSKNTLLNKSTSRKNIDTSTQIYDNEFLDDFKTINEGINRFEFSNILNNDDSDYRSTSYSKVQDLGVNLGQQPLPPNIFAKRKRHSRSVENIIESDINSSHDYELLTTQTLHFVDKLQSDPEQCRIPGKRIIILKNHTFKPKQFFPVFVEEVKRTVQIANTINDLLLITRSPQEDFMDVFFAMTQSLVETGPLVTGCAIAFDLVAPASSSGVYQPSSSSSTSSTSTRSPQSVHELQSLFPYSYRTREGAVVITDLSRLYKPQTTTWFSVHVNKSLEGLLKPQNRIYANKTDIGNLTFFNAKWEKTVTVSAEDGYWATPYYDCLLRNWIIQYSIPFYQLDGITPTFKGVVLLEANFEAIQINQCAEDGSLFSNSHRCISATTQCKNIPSSGLRVGSYQCVCKDGYQFPIPNAANQFFNGRAVENSYLDYVRNITSNYTSQFNCLLMTTASSTSTPHSAEVEPIVVFDFMIRGISLGIQSFCMTVSVVIGTVIICLRKTKVMRSSIWILLEMMLIGAILLYATVVIQYFEPTTIRCLLLPWCREVGFAIVYGVLVLKIYRILAEFQSRKAHRVHVRDKDLLKYLAVILTVVIAYMSAWTAVNMDHLDNNSTIIERLHTQDDKLAYTLCRSMWWDYVIEAGEFIFLCFGMYMCYCVRSAPTEYSEGRFITGAICYEAVMSAIFYVLRHLWWYEMHPDHLFLMFFLRCQLTVTIVLIIILGPKLWYAHRPPDEDLCRSRAYSQSDVQDSSSPETMKLNVGISSNGDVEVGEISLTEMDPEDIRVRAELKRLYTQLQIYKTKTMRKDNPHISKRRGGRKQTHRRFSLQAFHHKHRHQHDHEHEHEMSKTPEESTNSAEAMAFSIEPSVKEDPNEGRPVPSVTFKSGHK